MTTETIVRNPFFDGMSFSVDETAGTPENSTAEPQPDLQTRSDRNSLFDSMSFDPSVIEQPKSPVQSDTKGAGRNPLFDSMSFRPMDEGKTQPVQAITPKPNSQTASSRIFDEGVIWQESRGRQFDADGKPLTSKAGATGIAQVMPGTAPEAARLAGLPYDEYRYRNDPDYNAALGRAYFNKQLETFGNEAMALAAYNAGPGNVQSAIKKASASGAPGAWLSYLPAETRDYVPKILNRVYGSAATISSAGNKSSPAPSGGSTGSSIDQFLALVDAGSNGIMPITPQEKPKDASAGDYAGAISSGIGTGVLGIQGGIGKFIQAPAANSLAGVAGAAALADKGVTWLLNKAGVDAKPNDGIQEFAQGTSRFAAEQRLENAKVGQDGEWTNPATAVARIGLGLQEDARTRTSEIAASDAKNNPNLVRQQQALSAAEGFLGNLKAIVDNPLAFTHTLARSAPDMLVGMGVSRLAASGKLLEAAQAGEAAAANIARAGGNAAAQAEAAAAAMAPMQAKAIARASSAGLLSEAASSGINASEGVYQQVMNLPEQKLASSPRYQALLSATKDPSKAREILANELSDQSALPSAFVTGLGTGITNKIFGGDATAKTVAGVDRLTGKELVKRVGQDTAEEVIQGVPEDVVQHGAMVQADKDAKLDIPGSIAQNAAAGLAMSGSMHGAAYAKQAFSGTNPVAEAAKQPNSPLSRAAVAAGAAQSQATPNTAPTTDVLTARASVIEGIVRGDGKENPGLLSQIVEMDDDAGTGMQGIMDLLATAKSPSAPQSAREHSLQALEAAIQLAGGVIPAAPSAEAGVVAATPTDAVQQQTAEVAQPIAPQSLDERITSVENLVRGGKTGGQFIEWLRIADPSGGKAREVMDLLGKAKGRLVPIKTRERAMDAIDAIIEQSRLMAGPQKTGDATAAMQPAQAAEQSPQPSSTPAPNQGAQTTLPGSDATLAPAYMPGMEISTNREKPKATRILQPRKRDSQASTQQMRDNAVNLDYLQVGPSSVMGFGAPIVFGDLPSNSLLGEEQLVTDMNGKHIATRYAIVDAGDVIASNRIDGSPVREYETGAPGKLRAIVGNGRKESISHAYDIGTAQQRYLPPLLQNASKVGIEAQPQAMQAMKKPMLVRVMDEADITDNLGAVSNWKPGLEQPDSERAANDARDVDFGELSFDDQGHPTEDAVVRFIASLPNKNDAGNLITHDGRIAPQAYQRLEAAAFKYAYEDDALVEQITMEPDPVAKRVLDAAKSASGVMAALKGQGEFDLSLAVADAIKIAINAARKTKATGHTVTLSEEAHNQDFDISDEGRTVAAFLGSPEMAGSSKRMGEALRRWGMLALQNARIAEENQHQGGLLGPAPTLSRKQIFAALGSESNPTEQAIVGRAPVGTEPLTQTNIEGTTEQSPQAQAQPAALPTPSNFSGKPSATMGTRVEASAGPGFGPQDVLAKIKPKPAPQPNDDGLQMNASNKPFSSEGAAKLALRKFGQGRVVPVEGGYAIKLGEESSVESGEGGVSTEPTLTGTTTPRPSEGAEGKDSLSAEENDNRFATDPSAKWRTNWGEAKRTAESLGLPTKDGNRNLKLTEMVPAIEAALAQQEGNQKAEASAHETTTESGPFGPILTQYRHDAQGAIKALTELQDGEAVAALHHPEIGDIDLVWGKAPEGKAQGLGLAKLLVKHPEVLGDLQGFLDRLQKDEKRSGPNRVRLTDGKGEAVVSLDWKGDPKRWLLTAYELRAGADTSMDTASNDLKDDTARLEPSQMASVAQPHSTTQATTAQPKTLQDGTTQKTTRSVDWKKSYSTTKTIAESLGIALRNDSGKFKKLPELVAEIEDKDQAKTELSTAAHEAATSSQNDHPEPTEAQKEAGNYRKGHIRLNGHDISIENPAGTQRSPEWPPLQNHYGYIKGTVGADKDHVDVFMTDRAHDPDLPVFVVDQVNKDGSFDEHKVVMGAANETEARQTYLGNYEQGWMGLGSITQMSQDEFKAWVRDPKKTKKPLDKALLNQGKSATAQQQQTPTTYQWTGAPNGLATNKDPVNGGIVDVEPVSGKWFAVPNAEGAATLEGFDTKDQAIAALKGIGDQAIDTKAAPKQAEAQKQDTQGPYARWNTSTFAERRTWLRESGYTDGDQNRVLSGTDWSQLTDPVRNALVKLHQSRNMTSTAPTAQQLMQAAQDMGKLEVVYVGDRPKAETSSADYGSKNTLVSQSRADELRAKLREKAKNHLFGGLDTEMMAWGTELAVFHLEAGVRKFTDLVTAMAADLGTTPAKLKPYLRSWYNGARDMMEDHGLSIEGMDSPDAVRAELSKIGAEASPSPSQGTATSLADSLLTAIRAGNMPKDNPALKKLVEAFDGKPADQARMKEAQEQLEAAIVAASREVVAKGDGDKATFDALLRLYESQPNLNVRTSTSIANQAYSTPAPLAYLASQLAGITQRTLVHEPTAGTGMLLIGANPKNAVVNELNDLRVNLLKQQGFTPTQTDAAIGPVRDKRGSVDAVITNPPFGSVKDESGKATKVKVDGYNIGQIDHLIAANALKTMKDDGRAVLILGANKATGGLSTDDRIFFNWLYSHYNVVGHFEVNGDLYSRQGAGWPVRVIAIAGREKSAHPSPVAGTIQRADNWSQVYEQYQQLLDSSGRPVRVASTAAVRPSDGQAKPSSVPNPAISEIPSTDQSGRGQRAASDGDVARAGAGTVSDRTGATADPVGHEPDEQRLNAQSFVPPRLVEAGQATELAATKRPAQPAGTPPLASTQAEAGNEFQSTYTPRSSRKDEGVLIPANMAQPTQDALNHLEDQVGDIDEFARKELGYESTEALHNALMGLQVDSVATAIHQIKQGKAVVIADQTGIGKGRQAASIIRWAARNGLTPVFVSVKPSLFTDMYGDLADIGTHDVAPFIMNADAWVSGRDGEKLFGNKASSHRPTIESITNNGALPAGRNALFMTYSQINTDNVQRRALRALAGNAVFILDESHNAAGASGTGDFMISVLKEARGVTYLSATYAKRPDNMPLYFKTDIGDAAADSEGLANAMAAGGLPLQTVVSNNLVKAGQMFRRERSYDGVSIASTFDTKNRAAHEGMSDTTTQALRAIVRADRLFHEIYVKALDKQIKKEGGAVKDIAGNQAAAGVQHTEFSSVVHNFVRQMLLGLKAQTAADEAIASLKRGEKPIIAVENTMGSFLAEYAVSNGLSQGDSLGAFDYRTVLSRALERSRALVETLPTGEDVRKTVSLEQLDPITRHAYDQAQEIIDGLEISIPVSPIDWMRSEIERAGFSVAEITGRNLAVDYSDKGNPALSAIDQAEQRDKVATTRRFNGGELDALILNVAGSTGISLHASEKFQDQRQRHMIVAQAAGDINIFMQMLGRIHRTGQVRLPKYTILSVDLPTEKRPTAVLSKKMKSLNANTSSNTESATSVKTADILNKYGDQIVHQYLQDNMELARQLDVDDIVGGDSPTEDIARKATGRLALQPIEVQNAFYDDVEAQYAALIDYLNKTNQNDLEPRTFDFDAKETRTEILFDGPNKATPFGADAIYGEYSIKAQGTPMTPNEIKAAIDGNLNGKTGAAHAETLSSALLQVYTEQFNQAREKAGTTPATFAFDKYVALMKAIFGDRGVLMAEEAKTLIAKGASLPALTTHDMMSAQGVSTGLDFIKSHAIGRIFRVEINSEPFNAVVTNVRNTHKATGNPFSLSKLQLTVAVNGALRSITVPATQFRKIEVSSVAPAFQIEQMFKEQPANQRETAKIITGNLLAAYGELKGVKGTIISFTKSDGGTEQGILLPKLFDYTKNTQGDYRLRSGAEALNFLRHSENKDIGRFGIATRDGQVRVLPYGDGVQVRVPKSKLQGARYFLDKNLISITGDFVSTANAMVAKTGSPADATKLLDLLMDKQALYTLPSMADEAKEMAPKETQGNSSDTPNIRFSRNPSDDMFSSTGGMSNFLSIMNAPRQGVADPVKQELVASVRATAEAIQAAWGNAPKVEVAFDMNDPIIPQAARDADLEQRSRGATGDPEGFYFDGKVYLLASRLTNPEDTPRVLMHESLGHYGLHGVFGAALGPLLDQMAAMRPRDIAAKAISYGLYDRNQLGGLAPDKASPSQILAAMSPKQRRIAAEEVLAEMAQDQPTLGFVQRAIAAIRTWLRNHVPMLDSLALTDDEIVRSYILPARGFVERGHVNNAVAGQLQFNRADNASHANDTDPGQADNSEDTRRAIGILERGLGGDYMDAHPIQGWNTKGIQAVIPIAQAFGAKIVGYKVGAQARQTGLDPQRVGTSNGAHYGGYTFLNAETDRPHLAVLGHETAHEMRRKRPDLYFDLLGAIAPYVNESKYESKFRKSDVAVELEGRPEAQQEEFVGEVLSDGFMDRNFWRALGNKNPSLLAEVWGAVSSLLNKVFSKYGKGYTRQTEQYLTDYNKVMQIAGEVMAEYGMANPAIGNSTGHGPDIRFSRTSQRQEVQERQEPTPATWQAPETGRWDEAAYNFQDRHIDTKRVQQAIEAENGTLADGMNVRQREELFYGRDAKEVQDFKAKELNPMLEQLGEDGIDLPAFEEYLHARHAPEANRVMAERNPNQDMINAGRAKAAQDISALAVKIPATTDQVQQRVLKKAMGNAIADLNRWNKVTPYSGNEESRLMLSGMSDDQAKAVMDSLTPQQKAGMERSAAMFDAIVAKNRAMLVDYGLESQDTVDSWGNLFQHYVPLMREEPEGLHNGLGTGQGFSIKGREVKSRTGSTRKVVDIVANLAMQREKAITRGEKNRVVMTLMELAKANPNPDFWKVGAPDKVQKYDPETRTVKWVTDPLYKSRDEVIVGKALNDKGQIEEVALTFNKDDPRALRMAKAMKNLDDASLNKILQSVAPFTRTMAALSTQYNVMWGVFNFMRDTTGVMVSLGNTPLTGKNSRGESTRLRIYKDAYRALLPLYHGARQERNGREDASEWGQLWEEFQKVGGATGFRDMLRTSSQRTDQLQTVIDPDAWMETTWGKAATLGGTIKPLTGAAKRGAEAVFNWISDFNLALENSTRLATYKAGLDKGLSKEQAASIAKNITVNFNRRGAVGHQVGAAYAFFNASLQGTARMAEALTVMDKPGNPKSIRLSEYGKRVVLGSLALGMIQAFALAAAGFGADEPPEFVRDRNLTIPSGWTGTGPEKGYITLPMPLGYNIIPAFGRRMTEFLLAGGKDPFKHLTGLLSVVMDGFNPIGSGSLLQMVMPTTLDPIFAARENRDSFGRAISRETLDPNIPAHQMARHTATAASRWLSERINAISGGDRYTKGEWSPGPEQIDYAVGQYGGGVAREIMKLWQSASGMARGEDVPLYKIPLLGRFGGSASGPSAQANAYYNNMRDLDKEEKRIKGLREDGHIAESMALQRSTGPYLIAQAKTAEREVRELRKTKATLLEKGAAREEVARIEQRMTAAMRRLNEAVERQKQRAATVS